MPNEINIHYVYDDKENNIGHIDYIDFHDRDAVHFNPSLGVIDLSTLKDYKDYPFVYHCDGETKKGYIGTVESRMWKQPDGIEKEVMAVNLHWEDENGEEK